MLNHQHRLVPSKISVPPLKAAIYVSVGEGGGTAGLADCTATRMGISRSHTRQGVARGAGWNGRTALFPRLHPPHFTHKHNSSVFRCAKYGHTPLVRVNLWFSCRTI